MSKRVKGLFVAYGIKQEELSKALGVSRETVSAKVNGKTDWKLGEAQVVKNMLKTKGVDMTVDEIFFADDFALI